MLPPICLPCRPPRGGPATAAPCSVIAMPGTAPAWIPAPLGRGPVWGLLPVSEALFTLDVPGASTSSLTHTTQARGRVFLGAVASLQRSEPSESTGPALLSAGCPDPLCLTNEPFLGTEEVVRGQGAGRGNVKSRSLSLGPLSEFKRQCFHLLRAAVETLTPASRTRGPSALHGGTGPAPWLSCL